MLLDRVTLTGADDTVDPQELVRIHERFPFVEWGILLSASAQGGHRFPSQKWLSGLRAAIADKPTMKLSLHVCGRWVRSICGGNWTPLVFNAGWIIDRASRVQLNFHAYQHLMSDTFCAAARTMCSAHEWQLVFQVDGVNDHLVAKARDLGVDAVPLFDRSGGAGVSPDEWPAPITRVYCGYAGGIGPDNVVSEIARIRAVCQPTSRVWIDMESKLYDADDRFSIEKCESVLSQCSSSIKKWRGV